MGLSYSLLNGKSLFMPNVHHLTLFNLLASVPFKMISLGFLIKNTLSLKKKNGVNFSWVKLLVGEKN